MSNDVQIVNVNGENVVVKYDILDKKYKYDYSVEPSNVQLDVGVLVQGSIVSDLIDEVVSRVQMDNVLSEYKYDSSNDPSYVWWINPYLYMVVSITIIYRR